jgi:hypothetical protein
VGDWARVVTETAFDVTVAFTQRLTNGATDSSLRRTGAGGGGGAEKRKPVSGSGRAGGNHVAKLARRYISEWAGREGEEGRVSPVPVLPARATCPLRCTIGRNAAATISYLREESAQGTLVVLNSELTDEEGGVA